MEILIVFMAHGGVWVGIALITWIGLSFDKKNKDSLE